MGDINTLFGYRLLLPNPNNPSYCVEEIDRRKTSLSTFKLKPNESIKKNLLFKCKIKIVSKALMT